MSYPLVLLLLFGALFFITVLFWALRRSRRRRLLRAVDTMAFPEKYRAFLRRIAHYNALDPQERGRMERMMLRFMHTKSFEGVRLAVSEEMMAVTAFFACLTVLHKGEAWLEQLERVIVYAEDFIFDEAMEYEGVVTRGPFVLDGQSDDETVALSWEAAREEAYGLYPSSVVIHEIAHLLDGLDGEVDGVPPLSAEDASAWEPLLTRSCDAVREALANGGGNETAELFGEDGTLDEGEFFAVSSEFFFMCPARLHADFPELFGALERFYGCDPRRWGVEAEIEREEPLA